MSYNHFNNDLPVAPHGYKTWRAFYAQSLAAFSKLGDLIEPQYGMVLIPVGGDALQEIPYWKVAHYAAREQADEDLKHPAVKASELMELAYARVGPPLSTATQEWLDRMIQEAIEREGY